MNAIAIDGFSSTGKSSVAKILAQRLGYLYVDTGAMYRAVALHALRNGWVGPDGSSVNAHAAEALRAGAGTLDIRWRWEASGQQHTLLNGEDVEAQIRTMEIRRCVGIFPIRQRCGRRGPNRFRGLCIMGGRERSGGGV